MARLAVLFALLVTADALNLQETGDDEPKKDDEQPKKDDEQPKKADSEDDDEISAKPETKGDGSDDGQDGSARIDDPRPKYSAPFNLTNGACKNNKNDRYIMEITNVAHGSYYIGKMGFGTPAQELNMLLDTGSDEIVVKGAKCKGCKGRSYDHAKSSTYVINKPADDPQEGKEEVSYGSGDVWGQHVFDTISTGPLKGPNMDILEVTETTIQEFAETTDVALEVIAGMAPGLPEYVGQRMASHMQVRRFAQCLPQNADENGFFVVNDDAPKDKSFNGPFMSMGNYYWAVSIDSMRFAWTDKQKAEGVRGSSKSKALSNKKFSMLVDTGTTLLSLPQEVMDGLDKALEEIDSDCSKMDQLPALAFEIDGVTHTLPPSTYIAQESSGSTNYEKKKFTNSKKAALKEKSEAEEKAEERQYQLKNLYYKQKRFVNKKTGAECHLLFTQPITMNSTLGELGILGMPLFRNYMVSFDFCQRQIWTKPHSGDCQAVVGAHPSNKDGCADNDWLYCFFQSLGKWFMSIFNGFGSIFAQESTTRTGPRLKYIPGSDRMSAGARWLINQSPTDGAGVIEL